VNTNTPFPSSPEAAGRPERTHLRLGFVALSDAAPLAAAKILEFGHGHGLTLELCRQPSWAAVRDKARAEKVKISRLSSGSSFDFGGARIDVISPPADYLPASSPMNNDSLGIRITYGRRSLLLTGDMEKPMERRALMDGQPLRADIIKVGHHGSNTSSIDPFLDAVSPVFAVISDGFENSFRHPHPKVLERLSAHRAGILRTDRDGLVTIRTDGRRISIETFLPR